jgi:Domain of unknown function (DUF4336)
MIREVALDVWVAEQPLRFLGLELGARMTLVRLPGERLLVHSPIAWTRELAEEVERLGAPTLLVAPNRFHHLYARTWQSAYPSSRLFVAPGLERRRPDLTFERVLTRDPLPEWSDVLDQELVAGFPMTNEVVFFHGPSRTLIASDLVFNIGAESPPLTRFAFRLMGAYGRPASTVLERLLIRDRVAFRSSLERILAWPISQLILAHGSVVREGGHAALAEAYSWLLARDDRRAG